MIFGDVLNDGDIPTDRWKVLSLPTANRRFRLPLHK